MIEREVPGTRPTAASRNIVRETRTLSQRRDAKVVPPALLPGKAQNADEATGGGGPWRRFWSILLLAQGC